MRVFSFFVLPILLFGLSACSVAGFVVGAGAGTAVAASEERGLSKAVDDTALRAKINYALLDNSLGLFRRVSTMVHEGRVLLMGIVPNEDAMADAVGLCHTHLSRLLHRARGGGGLSAKTGAYRGVDDRACTVCQYL